MADLFRVVADGPLAPTICSMLESNVELLPWSTFESTVPVQADGVYTYGHPPIDGHMLDRLAGVRVVSNYGVGVDHIHLPDAQARSIPVGNTPDILNGATADMAMTLLLAAGRRLVEGDRFARSAEFTVYDPGYMLGQEFHHATLGIVGLGRIGKQIARRATAFDMKVLYHNRNRNESAENELAVRYVSLDTLLEQSDYIVLSCPLSEATRGLIGPDQLQRMKQSAILVNVARGAVVNTEALTDALRSRSIYAAGLDVTDPEPLPRDHPLLKMDNVTIAPHLGSATEQTRRKMAELSVENLLAGLEGRPLPHPVG